MNNWNSLIGQAELARVVADINSDGSLQMQNWRYISSFYSNYYEEISEHKELIENLFNIRGRIYIKQEKNPQYKISFISKDLTLFLNKIGVVEGRKTEKVFFVPDWIKKGSEKVKIAFLKGFYNCEGCVYATNHKKYAPRWRISIEQYKNENLKESGKQYMEGIRALLSYFDINTSPVRFVGRHIRQDGSFSIGCRFDIEKTSFKNFYSYIGFDNQIKQFKLKSAINE